MGSVNGHADGRHLRAEQSLTPRLGGGEADLLLEHGGAEGVARAHAVDGDGPAVEPEGCAGRGGAPGEGGRCGDQREEGDGGVSVLVRAGHGASSVGGLVLRVRGVSTRGGAAVRRRGMCAGPGVVVGRRERQWAQDRACGGLAAVFPDGLYDGRSRFSGWFRGGACVRPARGGRVGRMP